MKDGRGTISRAWRRGRRFSAAGVLAAALALGPHARAQNRGVSPRLQQIIEEQRYGSKGYIKIGDRWIPPEDLNKYDLRAPVGLAGPLEVHFIDVGQGDSTLVKCPDGANILVDGGGGKSTESLLAYLSKEKVEKIDLLISTHPDEDHIGGLPEVIRRLKVARVMDPGKVHTTGVYEDYLRAIREGKVPYVLGRAGGEYDFGEVKLEVLHPGAVLPEDNNNCSVVVRLTYGDTSFLLTGDAAFEAEEEMLQTGRNLRSDVLKCGHHGSRHSCSDSFVQQVRPRVAAISCGLGNKYGHPKKIVLDKMAALGAAVFRTDQLGTFVVESDGVNIGVRDMKKTLVAPRPPNLPFAYETETVPVNGGTGQVTVGGVLKININKATQRELETLKGIGTKKAQAIIDYREKTGQFKQPGDIKNVRGIGEKTYEKNKDSIVVR